MAIGTIKTVVLAKGFGFIAQSNGPDIFFHARDLPPDLPFDETLQERRVEFQSRETDKGTRAFGIVPAR